MLACRNIEEKREEGRRRKKRKERKKFIHQVCLHDVQHEPLDSSNMVTRKSKTNGNCWEENRRGRGRGAGAGAQKSLGTYQFNEAVNEELKRNTHKNKRTKTHREKRDTERSEKKKRPNEKCCQRKKSQQLNYPKAFIQLIYLEVETKRLPKKLWSPFVLPIFFYCFVSPFTFTFTFSFLPSFPSFLSFPSLTQSFFFLATGITF